jgi:hypothetical protein
MGVKGAHIPLGGHIHDEKNLALECAQFNIIAIDILQPSHTSGQYLHSQYRNGKCLQEEEEGGGRSESGWQLFP